MSAEPNVRAQTTADPALPPSDLSSKQSQSSNLPVAPEMPGSEKGGSGSARHIKLPSDLSSLLNTSDDIIVRLNKLLKTPGGLQSFLSTTNYGLYILAYLHSTAPSRAQIIARLATALGRTPSKAPIANPSAAADVPVSPIIPLALAISDLRTTLRLTGLIPLYVLLKSLIRSKEPDRVTYLIKLAQCLSYIGFQSIENVYHLTNKTVIASTWTNSRFSRFGGHAKLMTWSCRFWLAGISCDFLRLARESQLSKQNGTYARLSQEEKREADRKWWSEALVATSWYPMALHYAIEGGIGLNLGMIGACGFFANLGNFLKAWDTTA